MSKCKTVSLTETLPLTIQQEDVNGVVIGSPINILIDIQRTNNQVIITLPALNFNFPETEPLTEPWPASFPTGGYIDTVDNFLPAKYRHHHALPVSFFIESNGEDQFYVGEVDFRGRIRILGPQSLPVKAGGFVSLSSSVPYVIDEPLKICPPNFIVWPGFSNAAKYSGDTSLNFDFGDYDENKAAFHNNVLYVAWADNSPELPLNDPDQAYKSYALARVNTTSAKHPQVENVVNLSRIPGGEPVDPNFTYAEGSVAVDPTDLTGNTIVVVTQQRKSSSVGFLFTRSFDGGQTWERKLLGTTSGPLPQGGTDLKAVFDRFGGLFILYQTRAVGPNPGEHLIYSSDKGTTFTQIFDFEGIGGELASDFTGLAIGPDPNNPDQQILWMSWDLIQPITLILFEIYVKPIVVRGLNNIDPILSKEYHLTQFNFANIPFIDVGPSGEVVLTFCPYSFPHQGDNSTIINSNSFIQGNGTLMMSINENGLDGNFSPFKEITINTYAFGGIGSFPPAQPHRGILQYGTVSIDKSSAHPGRIYISYNDTLKSVDSTETKPFLIWSDNKGITWSSPLLLADDPKTTKNQIIPTLAIDDVTGKVAVTWHDARNDNNDGENVQYFGVILDPQWLPAVSQFSEVILSNRKQVETKKTIIKGANRSRLVQILIRG